MLVEFFAGVLSLALACERLNWRVSAHYFSEIDPDALLVASVNCPEA